MLQNACLLAKIGADTAESERNVAEAGPAPRRRRRCGGAGPGSSAGRGGAWPGRRRPCPNLPVASEDAARTLKLEVIWNIEISTCLEISKYHESPYPSKLHENSAKAP